MIKNNKDKIENSLLKRNFILDDIIYYNTYKDSKIKAHCSICNLNLEATMKTFMDGKYHKCNKQHKTKKYSTEEFKNMVVQLDNDYELIGEYKTKREKIEMLHISKNHTFFISPEDFKNGCRCSICYKKNKKTTEDFKNEIYSLVSDDYTVIGEYVGALKKIKLLHNKCNKEFLVRPADFIYKQSRCPFCMKSHTEEQLELILNNLGYEIIPQYSFSDCKDKHVLKFDFYIESINTCIEYDGEFHYIDIHGQLNKQIERDKIKTNYCKKKGINLIRIPYTDKNKINEEYLKQLLSKSLK